MKSHVSLYKKGLGITFLSILACTPTISVYAATNTASIDAAIARELASDPLTASVRKVLPSMVAISFISGNKIGAGTGLIVSKNGFILTNKHVVSDVKATYVVVLPNGTRKLAEVWYKDPDLDIALLKINATFAASDIAQLGSSSTLKKGTRVAAVGNSNGLFKNAISAGSVVAFNRSIHATAYDLEEYLSGLIESSTPLTQGYSGGPLVSTAGTVVGLNVAVDNKTGNSFAIPSDAIKIKINPYLNLK